MLPTPEALHVTVWFEPTYREVGVMLKADT